MAEADGGGVAAVLAADAELEVGPCLAAALAADPHELAHALAVDADEGILLQDALLLIGTEEGAGVVAREAEAGLREIVGPEAEELRGLRDLARRYGFSPAENGNFNAFGMRMQFDF